LKNSKTYSLILNLSQFPFFNGHLHPGLLILKLVF
jgi:hypothetical protein